MNRSLDQVNTLLDSLVPRLNQVDGVGLPTPSDSSVATIQAQIDGIKTTVSQVVNTLDAHLNDLEAQVAALQTLLNQHLGLSS